MIERLSPRDRALYELTQDGYRNEHGGCLEHALGAFSRISISADDIRDIAQAYRPELDRAGADPDELVGHFIVTEHLDDQVRVQAFDSEQSQHRRFGDLLGRYAIEAAVNHLPPTREPISYRSPRDEILHRMMVVSYCDRWWGHVASPYGVFGHVHNDEPDLEHIERHFAPAIERVRLGDVRELLGSFVLMQTAKQLYVAEYESFEAADEVVDQLYTGFAQWLEHNRGGRS